MKNVYSLGLLGAGLLFALNVFAADDVVNEGKATFAGGCFWCIEADFEKVPGVLSAVSGYIGGKNDNPTYREVSAGKTGHIEAVEIIYDTAKVSYAELLDVFWRNVDPTVEDQQFCDRGTPYQSHIFYHGEEQKTLADASKEKVIKTRTFSEKVLTPITAASTFWPAESYHQDYYKKNSYRYRYYRFACERDKRLKELWGDVK